MKKTQSKLVVENLLAVIIQCATLVVGLGKVEFRSRDIMFYLDLIKDILRRGGSVESIDIQFVQIQRWLQRYESNGWVSSKREGRVQSYRLGKRGVRGLLTSLLEDERRLEIPEALLVQQMLDAYGQYLRPRLQGKDAPKDLDVWLEKVLEPGIIFKKQLKHVEVAIVQHERRIQNSLRLQAYCQQAVQAGRSTEDIIEGIPSEFSYQLTNQKKFRDLLREVPHVLADFEVKQGFAQRHRRYYEPNLRYLKMERAFYLEMLDDAAGGVSHFL